jgi:two-component system, OmpR family, sensor histidine kinase VanS
MAKFLRSFRSRMILLLGLSMIPSGFITLILYKGLQLYYKNNVRYEDPLHQFRIVMNRIGDFNFFLIVFVPLVILFFYLFTKPYADYFRMISDGIHRLASGDFTRRVNITSMDEFQDIAGDINMASDQLKQAVERGDFAESSKDQLVLNLAHDLRTPLTSVLGYLDFILKDKQLTPEQIKHYAAIAYTKSQRLEKLIEELFEITRTNYGMLPIKQERLQLGELLVQLSEELYPAMENSELTARLELSPDLEIIGDGELLARVFENLLINAIRYGCDGQYIDVRGFNDEDKAVIQVTNYGSAIPSEDIPHLFDMFFTGDRARAHREGGTGLGLFIAKNIVERHNGTITVQSDLIRTIFEVRLPYRISAQH